MSAPSPAADLPPKAKDGWRSYGFCFFLVAILCCLGEVSVVGTRAGIGGKTGAAYALYMLAIASLLGTLLFAGLGALFVLFGKVSRALPIPQGVRWKLAGPMLGGVCAYLASLLLRGDVDPSGFLKLLLPLGLVSGYVLVLFWQSLSPRTLSLLLGLLAVLAFSMDAVAYRKLYQPFHDLAFCSAILLGTLSVLSVLRQIRVPSLLLRMAMAAVAAAILASVFFAFSDAPEGVQVLGEKHGVVLSKLMRAAHFTIDFDRDGSSAVFGGSDCNDFNADVYPGRCEIPGNGIDDNCNGMADPKTQHGAENAVRTPRTPLPDVYFIVLDALRHDFGDAPPPEGGYLSHLERESLTFDSAYTPFPSTHPTLSAILQSRYWQYIHITRKSMVDLVKEHGYESQLWVRDQRLPLQGTDWLFGMAVSPVHTVGEGKTSWTEGIIGDAVSELDRPQEGPRFRWLHFMDTHVPLLRKGSSNKERYQSEVRFLTEQIDGFVAKLFAHPRTKNAVVIVFSDHGEEFGEHGGNYHGASLYEESSHVVFYMRLPGVPPRIISGVASLIDLLPTFASYMGFKSDPEWQGKNWLSETDKADGPRVVSQVAEMKTWAGTDLPRAQLATDGRYKLIVNVDRNYSELYDLKVDPGETTRLPSGTNEAEVALRRSVTEWQDLAQCQVGEKEDVR